MSVYRFGLMVFMLGACIVGFSVLDSLSKAPQGEAWGEYMSCLYDLSITSVLSDDRFYRCSGAAGILTYFGAAVAIFGGIFMASAKRPTD